ncbi:MAG: ethanolamine ammonia-lyase subunit EutC [Chitinophagaceae bacterium]
MKQQDKAENIEISNKWQSLKKYTPARVALGRTGNAIPVQEMLQLKVAHAFAKDAVYATMDVHFIEQSLKHLNFPVLSVCSKAVNRKMYIQRPDLGRQLDEASSVLLQQNTKGFDVGFIIADGLSAIAIQLHSLPFIQQVVPLLRKAGFSIAPIVIASQARVAIGDAIGSIMQCKVSVVLIGERPGLSVCDSMGIYSTYQPAMGLTDESRNCISNIHANGLDYYTAAQKTFSLIQNSIAFKISGVHLKENTNIINLQ